MAPIATTSTFDSTDNEAVLSAQEQADQEAYEIGDRLVTEQETLLANKYRSPQELEEAYLELQRKLGEREKPEEPQDDQEGASEAEEDAEDPEGSDVLSRLAEAADAGGEWSEELLAEIDGLSPRDLANMFLEYREKQVPAEPYALTEADVVEMKGIVGGEQQYQAMCQWAAENLDPNEVAVFDSVVTELQDPRAVYFAIQALNYRYKEAMGYEPELLAGRTPSNRGDVFESHAQLVQALNDPRYDRDPAYRAQVEAKLERSGDLI